MAARRFSIVATVSQNRAGGEEIWDAHENIDPPQFSRVPHDFWT